MDFAADFTAIDFETASRRSDSACQLAAVVVRQGRIADSRMWMIRPKPLFFLPSHIEIHGITPERVRQEPEFGSLWPEIAQFLNDDCLVAHNAGFDIGVLLGCLKTHGCPVPVIQYTCTRAIARRVWPSRPRYGLKPLAQWLGIRFRHHDALEDSLACAKILLAAGIDSGAQDIADLEKQLRISRGEAGSWGYRSPRRRASNQRRKKPGPTLARPRQAATTMPHAADDATAAADQAAADQLDWQRLLIRAEFIRPLAGRSVVIQGRLKRLSHQQAVDLAKRLGGDCQDSVTERTDLVVVGSQTDAGSVREPTEATTSPRGAGGKAIQIVDEDEFLHLIIAR